MEHSERAIDLTVRDIFEKPLKQYRQYSRDVQDVQSGDDDGGGGDEGLHISRFPRFILKL